MTQVGNPDGADKRKSCFPFPNHRHNTNLRPSKQEVLRSQVSLNHRLLGVRSVVSNRHRVWVREGELTMESRIKEALTDFNTANQI